VPLIHYIEVLENCLGCKAQKNFLPLQLGDVPETFAISTISSLLAFAQVSSADLCSAVSLATTS
jgi:hypothetical protein